MKAVIKIGGSVLEPNPAPGLVRAVAAAVAAGHELVLVHGGGKALTGLLGRLGVASRFENGLRVTDEATLAAAILAFAGEVNTRLVGALGAAGVRAVGLTGLDAHCVGARIERPELGRVGAVTECRPELWRALLAAGFVPVLASLAGDGEGGALNVNADQFAAAVAGGLGAQRMIFVTDVPGVLDARGERLPAVTVAELETMAADGAIRGGMLPKAEACGAALRAGVGAVEIVGAEAALRLPELLASAPGAGTQILETA